VSSDQRYTLAEAQQELNRRHCATHGHNIDIICAGLSGNPVRLVCGCCGDSWNVQPKERA
jgi:hypothetical protein